MLKQWRQDMALPALCARRGAKGSSGRSQHGSAHTGLYPQNTSPRWKTLLHPLCSLPGHKIPFFLPKRYMKLYLKAIGVSITVTKGVQGVFVIQRRPLVGRHLHREISNRGTQRPGVEEEDEGQGRFTHLLKPPSPPGSKIPNGSEVVKHYTNARGRLWKAKRAGAKS